MAFKDWVTGLGYSLEIQTGGTLAAPTYTDISDIVINMAEAFNDVVDTFQVLESAISSSVKTAVDPEFTLATKGDKANVGMQALLATIWETNEDAVLMVRLTNTFNLEVVTFAATVSGYNVTFETPTVIEVAWSLKPYDGAEVVVADVEVVAPTISTYVPADDAVGQNVDMAFILTFSETVLKGIGDISIYKTADDDLIESLNVQLDSTSIADTVVTITRSVTLGADTEYYMFITEGAFTDLQGNDFAGIAIKTTWTFTTAA